MQQIARQATTHGCRCIWLTGKNRGAIIAENLRQPLGRGATKRALRNWNKTGNEPIRALICTGCEKR